MTTAPVVRERGVDAWTFIENEQMTDTDDDSNAAVMDNTTIIFYQGQGCVMTNLPIPMNQEFVYWEVKILHLEEQDRVAIGLGTKPYPCWRLPGIKGDNFFLYRPTFGTLTFFDIFTKIIIIIYFIFRLAPTFSCLSFTHRRYSCK